MKTILSRFGIAAVSSLLFAFTSVQAEISEQDLGQLKLTSQTDHVKMYVKPGADLSKYNQFMLNSTSVSMDEKWLKDYNNDRRSLTLRLKDRDVKDIGKRYEKTFKRILASTLEKEGKAQLSDEAGSNTLKVDAAIVNLKLNAPDTKSGGRTSLFIRQAGEAVLQTKMYDAVTGELIMVIIDEKETRDQVDLFETNRARNQSEFIPVYRAWAKNWLKGLEQKS
jgi:hypothetical protein